MTGRIHSMESFGTVDGPGIRFVVFLQGCRWRCRYCHNPDTWALDGGQEMTAEELARTALRYRAWFDTSGGGVTVSGGEPLLQAEFVAEFFERLKAEGIHTCLDTNGDCDDERVMERLLAVTDLVLLDIKHTDEKEHLILTGAGTSGPLAFLGMLSARGIPTTLRHVVVPGLTGTTEVIETLVRHAKTNPNIHDIQWLPYHRLGVFKWYELGIPYRLDDLPAAEEARMEQVRACAAKVFSAEIASPCQPAEGVSAPD